MIKKISAIFLLCVIAIACSKHESPGKKPTIMDFRLEAVNASSTVILLPGQTNSQVSAFIVHTPVDPGSPFAISFTVSDLSGVDHFNIQVSNDGQTWRTIDVALPADLQINEPYTVFFTA